MPLEDQGYCIVIAQLPAGLRSRACAGSPTDIDAILKQSPGVKGWVTIGGYSALDTAKLSNVITAFVMYDDWDKRPPAFRRPRSSLSFRRIPVDPTGNSACCRPRRFRAR